MEKLSEYTISLFAISLFLLAITFSLILSMRNSKNRVVLGMKEKELDFESELNKVQLTSIEEERRKLGSILHDDLGQTITLMRMQLASLQILHKKHGLEDASLPLLEDLCHSASDKCSSISKMLFPAFLMRLGIIEALQELISDVQLATKIHIDFKYEEFNLADENASNLYRIFQELLNNTIKHANATNIYISLTNAVDGVEVVYLDNGKGLNKNIKYKGQGMTTIMTRLHILKGTVIESNEQKGFNFKFLLPYGKN